MNTHTMRAMLFKIGYAIWITMPDAVTTDALNQTELE
jgi:hypothetical protein